MLFIFINTTTNNDNDNDNTNANNDNNNNDIIIIIIIDIIDIIDIIIINYYYYYYHTLRQGGRRSRHADHGGWRRQPGERGAARPAASGPASIKINAHTSSIFYRLSSIFFIIYYIIYIIYNILYILYSIFYIIYSMFYSIDPPGLPIRPRRPSAYLSIAKPSDIHCSIHSTSLAQVVGTIRLACVLFVSHCNVFNLRTIRNDLKRDLSPSDNTIIYAISTMNHQYGNS